MKRKYRYVESWGEVFRMTERQYMRYLRAGAKGDTVFPRDFGKAMFVIDNDTTDWDQERFASEYQSAREGL